MRDKPKIHMNYLSTDEDCQVASEAIRITRDIVSQQALQQSVQPVEYRPGPALQTRNELVAAARGDVYVRFSVFRHECAPGVCGFETAR